MSKHKYNQNEGRDTYRTVDSDGHYEHSGKALYGDDVHMTRLDIVSPVSGQPGYHHHEWWNEKDGYGHGIHEEH